MQIYAPDKFEFSHNFNMENVKNLENVKIITK